MSATRSDVRTPAPPLVQEVSSGDSDDEPGSLPT